jgi:hypothetical protein
MKKIVLILVSFTLLLGVLDAKETCYSVQLLSRVDNGLDRLDIQTPSSECKVMKIGGAYTLRCGCYSQYEHAKQKLKKYKQEYKKAMVVTTYAYRFKKDNSASNYVEKAIINTTLVDSLDTNNTTQHKTGKTSPDTKKSCYSVEVASTTKSQENLSKLFATHYPSGCKVMEFRNSFGVRCGCYDRLEDVENLYDRLKIRYQHARVLDTYIYRFKDDYKVSRSYQAPVVSKKDEELRLLLQVFLYKGDLENGYKVGKIGVKRYPNSYYWNDKMAQIAQWTNRLPESMKYMKKAYALSHDPQLESKLIAYGASNFQYEEIEPLVMARLKRDYSEENVDLMISVYKKIGVPEKILEVLDSEYKRHPNNTMLLSKALRISLEMGSLEDAKRYVELIEKNKPYSKEDAALLSRYYYITRDVNKAYAVLEDANQNTTEKSQHIIKFYELKSDLGWYLQKNLQAAQASKYLMSIDKARLVDYERISYVYRDKDPDLAKQAVRDGFKKYRLSYLFYSYANDAMNAGKFDELRSLMHLINEEIHHFLKKHCFGLSKQKCMDTISKEIKRRKHF